MAIESMTDAWVAGLKPPESGMVEYRDSRKTGLVLRINYGGRKTWYLAYRVPGIKGPKRFKIGTYPRCSLRDARARAEDILRNLEKGIDPAREKQESRKALTFSILIAQYMKRHVKNLNSWKEVERILNKEVGKVWGDREVEKLDRREIRLHFQQRQEEAPVSARNAFVQLRAMLNWALREELIQTSPCTGLKAPEKPASRDRVLTHEEVRKFWQATEQDFTTFKALRMILLTAQRPMEVAGMRWDELDLDTGWWNIPKERTKNKKAHRVPLGRMALEIIKKQSREGDYVFPSKSGRDHVGRNSLSQSLFRLREGITDVRFTPHDLRRTAASLMAGAGVSRIAIHRLLNHTDKDITAVYDRYGYDREKKVAVSVWESTLAGILKGETERVVELAGM